MSIIKPIVKKLSHKYIAGDYFSDAEARVEKLNFKGGWGIYNLLGESSSSSESLQGYMDLVNQSGSMLSSVSIKLSNIDCNKDFLIQIAERADYYCQQLSVDMEGMSKIDETIQIVREVNESYPVGCVLQANMNSSLEYSKTLENMHVRVCKGAYYGDIQRDKKIRHNFNRIASRLLRNGCRVALATHDLRLAKQWLGDDVEYQFLYGVKHVIPFIEKVKEEHKISVYIPFGKNWYEYSLRRIDENPFLMFTVAKDVIREWLKQKK